MTGDAIARDLKGLLIDTILFCQLDGLALGLVGIVAKALKAVRSVAQLAVKQSQRLPTQDRVIQNRWGDAEACSAGQKSSSAVTGVLFLYCRLGSISGLFRTVKRRTEGFSKNSARL